MLENEGQDNNALFILTVSSAHLGPFFKQRVSIGQQQLSIIQVLAVRARSMLQGLLVTQGHLVGSGHIHQAGGLVFYACAVGGVRHLIEVQERLRESRGGAGKMRLWGVLHQVHNVAEGLGRGRSWCWATVPQV